MIITINDLCKGRYSNKSSFLNLQSMGKTETSNFMKDIMTKYKHAFEVSDHNSNS